MVRSVGSLWRQELLTILKGRRYGALGCYGGRSHRIKYRSTMRSSTLYLTVERVGPSLPALFSANANENNGSDRRIRSMHNYSL